MSSKQFVILDKNISKCPDHTDTLGTFWNEIIGNGSRILPCNKGFSGMYDSCLHTLQ